MTPPAMTPVPAWAEEQIERATAVAHGSPRADRTTCLPPELARRIDSSEERAATISAAAGGCEEGRRAATLEFVAEAVATLVLENAVKPGEVRRVVADVGAVTGVSAGAASLAVFLRAIAARDVAQLPPRLAVYLRELASALTPLFERDMLFERHAARERSLVSGGERRLVRLGFDLHDGPLQELVALADDLRHARDQVASVLDDPHRSAVRGRFDDLEARLGSLDRGLRDIAHSVRATSAVEQPLEHALRNEADALERSSGIDVELAVDGDVASLTDSQKIALFRVVQESL